MLCARSCPDWCIYIEGHKELAPPRRAGGKPRKVNKLDRFDIDYALCMYCGICVEVCPFDALFWSPEYEYSEPRIADLLHDKDKLGEWMETVPEAPELEAGADKKERSDARRRIRRPRRPEHRLRHHRRGDDRRRVPGRHAASNVVHAALWLVVVLAGAAAQYLLLAAEFVAVTQVLVYVGAVMVLFLFGVMLTRATARPRDGPEQQRLGARHPGRAADARRAWLRRCIDGVRGREARRQHRRSVEHAAGQRRIFGPYLLPFWALSFVLLAAVDRRHRPGQEGLNVLINQFLLLGAVLFCIGVYGVIARKNAVIVLMSIELILNSVNINLLAFAAARTSTLDGNMFALYIIAVAAAEVGVGLAMVLLIYRNRRSIALDELSEMKG